MDQQINKKVVYIFDDKLLQECNRLPMVLNRASVVHDLINSYGLLNSVEVIKCTPATEDDIKLFHSTSFVEFLKTVNESEDLEVYDEAQEEYGFGYDCCLLERNYDLIKTIAGSSVTAAKLLTSNKCNIAINWFGGWHHAQRDTAEGFCYVNDIVIAIQTMLGKFKKVLYVDLDIHHGDGVQNAFELSKKVLTLSFHKLMAGFYPGTGSIDDIGILNGKYYTLNVPLLEGIGDDSYFKLFSPIFAKACEIYNPDVIVVQCGADGIFQDPLGESNLTPKGLGKCVEQILKCEKPMLFLGGGGYNNANAARLWTYLTSIIVNEELPEDIPDSSEYFTEYVPSYELHISPGNQKDTNTQYRIDSIVSNILDVISFIE